MITSVLLVGLFIGTVMPSISSASSTTSELGNRPDFPECETCREAVDYAVDYMKVYVKENINNTYFLWSIDVVILIFEGLIKGIEESDFDLEIDENELKASIDYWVNITFGLQKFTVTLFLAKLGAIVIGVTGYLISLCNDTEQYRPAVSLYRRIVSRILSRIYNLMRVLNLVGL
jgi:hypothetical protein